MNTCSICNKTFDSQRALTGHKRMHGPSGGSVSVTYCSCIYTKKQLPVQRLSRYQAALLSCKNCNKLFRPGDAKQFCGLSCSASFTNRLRGPKSLEVRQKTSHSMRKYASKKPNKKIKPEYVGEYSVLYGCSCKHCGIKFVSRAKKQFCEDHKKLYCQSSREGYKFAFNIFNYPDLFDLDLLKEKGWFSAGGRTGRYNTQGLSRDHRVSVNEAIANNYDPYYIRHPVNCELISQRDNCKKNVKSSITFEELKKHVDEYDKQRTLLQG